VLRRDYYETRFGHEAQGICAYALPSAYLDVMPWHAQLRQDGIRLYDRKQRKGALHESITYQVVQVVFKSRDIFTSFS
jgi:hypothetical protein